MTKYLNTIRENFDKYDYPVFTITDIRVLLNKKSISPRYLKILINNLIKTKEIRRITKGVYTFHTELAVIGFGFRPFYYGMEDALTYRNFWTQSTNPVIMTTNGAREGLRQFQNSNYVVKRVKPELFFGFNFIKHYDLWIPVSDPEKTLIDLLYYRHGIQKDALGPLLDAIDPAKLKEYLKSYESNFRKKALAYLAFRKPQAPASIPARNEG